MIFNSFSDFIELAETKLKSVIKQFRFLNIWRIAVSDKLPSKTIVLLIFELNTEELFSNDCIILFSALAMHLKSEIAECKVPSSLLLQGIYQNNLDRLLFSTGSTFDLHSLLFFYLQDQNQQR